ncbi:hypothetical protein V6Z11_A12G083800 [Gossypium hirsutum]
MALQAEGTQQIQSPPLMNLDGLLCEEEDLGVYSFEENGSEIPAEKENFVPLFLNEHDLFWEDDELISLMSKEKQTHQGYVDFCPDESLVLARKEALDWVFKVEEARYVFDSKTIQRMELLVLSTLQWRMNPVTPISFFDHITRRLGLRTHLHWDFLRRCEHLLLFLITDSRFVTYTPSILAAATMLHVIKEVEPCHYPEYQKQLIAVLKACEDKVNACYKLISELLESQYKGNQGHKRKYKSIPSSPNGVIDASFGCDSSDDSWAVTSSVSSSPQPLFKRSRAQDQQMRLPSLNRMFVDVLSSPR